MKALQASVGIPSLVGLRSRTLIGALLGTFAAQRNEQLRATMQDFHTAFCDHLTEAVKVFATTGVIDPKASPDDVPKALLDDTAPTAIGRGIAQHHSSHFCLLHVEHRHDGR